MSSRKKVNKYISKLAKTNNSEISLCQKLTFDKTALACALRSNVALQS